MRKLSAQSAWWSNQLSEQEKTNQSKLKKKNDKNTSESLTQLHENQILKLKAVNQNYNQHKETS